jgi:hypothetical protein
MSPPWATPGYHAETYAVAAWLFLRLMGLVYLAAFLSLSGQIKGLVGENGIIPLKDFLASRRKLGFRRFWQIPTVFWLNGSDSFLVFLCWGGAALALLLIAGIAPLPVAILLWIIYLSLFTAGRIFLGYQWDILLLETGFLTIFLAPFEWITSFPPLAAPPKIVVWLGWWLLFRLMFSSGVAKWRSGDKNWRNFTALRHHYETQPLPTPLAWNVHQLPLAFHKLSTGLMFFIELVVPFFIFAPPPIRHFAAGLIFLLMLLICVTGNYAFFNLLTAALCVLLFDDRALAPVMNWLVAGSGAAPLIHPPGWFRWIAIAVALLIAALSLQTLLRLFRVEIGWRRPLRTLLEILDPFRLVNSYGLFAVMTTERPEIIIEGSHDGREWRAYEFKWKPGDMKRAPRIVAPHQPRLDWQMWFTALGFYQSNLWFKHFLARLLDSSTDVVALLRDNPFPQEPPRFIRAVLYDYRFTDSRERQATGAWWKRERRGLYCPVLELTKSTVSDRH